MISYEKEKKILALIASGLTNREISRDADVSYTTIAAIRQAGAVRPRGVCVMAHKILRKPHRCSICGAMIKVWPCVACSSEQSYPPESEHRQLLPAWSTEQKNGDIIAVTSPKGIVTGSTVTVLGTQSPLFRWPIISNKECIANAKLIARAPILRQIASEICELRVLELFHHPLFNRLARRAETVIREIEE